MFLLSVENWFLIVLEHLLVNIATLEERRKRGIKRKIQISLPFLILVNYLFLNLLNIINCEVTLFLIDKIRIISW